MKLKLKKRQQEVGVNGETGVSRGTFMNKRGAGFAVWLEIVVMLIITLISFSYITVEMDSWYAVPAYENHTLTYWGNWTATANALGNLSTSGQTFMTGGEVTTSFWGFNWKPAWTVIATLGGIIITVITGGWIPEMMKVVFQGSSIAYTIGIILQGFFLIGLVMMIVSIVTKVKNW